MKNLFKSLMLVAVAAMAFTACSQDNNEVNKLERKTVYNFQANIADDDTRSGFAEKEEGATAYKSEWFGDETIKVFVTNYSDYNAVTTASINAEGKFSFELENAPENFFMTVCSPAESWESEYTAIIPTEQTPLANSVDPKAHLLNTAGAVYVQNGVADKINMTHQVAYGKMTVNGVDFEIDHVVIDLVGSFYGSARELSYTINADNVENNTFWFATQPIEVAEFTVTAVDAEGNAVAKTVDVAAAEKTLLFNYSRVSTFSVSGLEEVEAPAAPAFTSAAWTNSNVYDKLVQFYSEEFGTLQLNFYNCNSDAWLDARTYGFADSGDIYPGSKYSWYKDEAAGINTEIIGGTVIVAVVDGQYFIEFKNLVDWDGKVYIEYATFTGKISGLQLPDTREQLAMPNATATAEGNVINISWDPVTGADEYYVFCYAGGLDSITTTETYVTIEAAYGTKYDFLIRAIANDSNPDYKNSEDYYFSVTTDKDPNALAVDVVLSEPASDSYSSYGFCFRMNYTDDSGKYFRFFFNEADRPGNNSLNTGIYTGIGNGSSDVYSPDAGKFAATMFDKWGSRVQGYYARAFKASSTVEVTYADNEYTIILTHEGKTYGYKGMPEGWVAPNGDNTGEGGETPEPEIKDSYNVTWEYYFDSSTAGTFGHVWNVSSGDGGFSAQISTDSRNNRTTSTSFTLGEYAYHTEYADGNYGSGMYFTMRSIEIEGVGYSNYDVNGVMVVTHDNGVYGITIDLYNYINGYTTDKITTLVGTFGSADSGSGDGGETTDPENPGEGETTVPEGYIELNQCIYYGDLYGAGLADEFVLLSADGKNQLFFNINNSTTASNYIPTGEYTLASAGSPGYTFNMSTLSGTTYINGQAYGNGVADNSSSTMSVVSEGEGGIHEIKLTINNNQGTNKFYFKGTIN